MKSSARHAATSRRILATSIAAALTAVVSASGAVLTWDITPGTVGVGDGTITGGAGVWDTFSGFWTSNAGANNVAWNNANNDQAVFQGVGGFVSLNEAITANSLTFNGSDYTLSGSALTLAGATPTITVGAGLNATISSVITGSAGLVVAGGGGLTLTAANTFTGGTTVNAGIVTLTVGGPIGTLQGPLTINTGATVVTTALDALGYNNGACVDIVNINGGTLDNATTGNQAFITNFSLTGGTMASSGGGAYNFNTGFGITTNASAATSFVNAPIVIRGGSLTFTTATGTTPTGVDLAITGIISGGTNSITKAGNGTMSISVATTYTGGTTVNGGVLDLVAGGGGVGVIRGTATVNSGATLRLSTADALGFNTQVTVLNVNSGTVNVNTTGNQTFSNMTLTMNAGTISGIAGGHIDLFNNGTSIVTTGAATSSVISVPTMGLRQNDTVFNVANGAAAADLLVSGNLINNSGANNQGNHNLIKNGNGNMQLTGNNTYTGTTRVNAGTLSLSGTGTLASPSITIVSGALFDVTGLTSGSFELITGQTLNAGRTGAAANDVLGNLTSGLGTINSGGFATAATLTLGGNLTLNGGAVGFDLSNLSTIGGGVNDLVSVGNLTLTGSTSIAINKLNGVLVSNTYTLFKYTGTLAGDATNLALSGAAGGTTRQTFTLSTATPGSVLLTVAGDSANLVWAGDGTANLWDVVTTSNFKNGAVADKFFDGDGVTFDDTGSVTPSIQIVGTVAPGSLTVNNTAKDYTFLGGSISGGTALTKNGNGALTLGSVNSFTGAVAINAGTIIADSVANIGVNSPLGAGNTVTFGDATHAGKLQLTAPFTVMGMNRAVTVNAGGGTIEVVDIGSTLTLNGAIVLNGPLTKAGGGSLTLPTAITGTGGLNFNGGTITVTAFSSYTGDLNLNAGIFNANIGLANGVNTALGAGNGTRNVTIGAGAQMNWTVNNIFIGGGGNAANLPTITINGGTLNSTRFNVIGNVVLNSGAALTQAATDGPGAYEGFQFIGTVTVGGTSASTISTANGKANHLRGGGTTTFNVGDATSDANPDLTISTVIRDGSGDSAGVGSLQKTGAGKLLMTAANIYTGPTTISAGTLTLSETGSIASTLINVAGGAAFDVSAFSTLGGYTVNPGVTINAAGGTIAGPISISFGATLAAGRSTAFANDLTGNLTSSGTINVGGVGTAGTFAVGGGGNIFLNGGTVSFDLGIATTLGAGVNDLLTTPGTLNLTGVTDISINRLTGSLGTGSYTLISYGGALVGGLANLNLVGLINSARQSFALDAATPGAIRLTVTGTPGNLIWVGNGAGNEWDTTTVNWTGAVDNHFLDGDSVTFNDSGSNTPPVQIVGTVRPSSIIVNNTTKDYTFGGAGQIDGTVGIVKNGTGTLTITNFNSFTGPVTINAGTVSVASIDGSGIPGALGAGTNMILGSATERGALELSGVGFFGNSDRTLTLNAGGGEVRVLDAAANLTLSSPIGGEGSLTKTGNGTLTLSNFETHTGGTIVNGGNLVLTTGGVAGVLRGTITINPGATLTSQAKDVLGYGADRTLTININGGTLTHTQGENISVWGMTVNMTGGTFLGPGGRIDLGTDGNAGNIPTVVNTFASPNVSTMGGTSVNLRQANTTFTVADGIAEPDVLVSAPITGGIAGASVTKAGPGSMEVTATANYTGATNITGGRLIVTGSIAGSAVTVSGGASLLGGGILGALNVQSGGVVSPGNPLATLSAGSLLMSSGSALVLELNTPVAGTGYDQLSITGSADVTGSTLALGGTYFTNSPAINDLFFILLNDGLDGVTGTFAGLAQGSTIQSTSGQPFMITYLADSGANSFTGGNDVALMAIPEPGAALSLMGGLGMLLGLRRRRAR